MLDGERALGPTIPADKIGWLDFESKSSQPIEGGTYRYSTGADALICAYAIGDGPVRTAAIGHSGRPLLWRDMPAEVREFHGRVARGDAKWCAWKAEFDRAIWNYGTLDFPAMPPEQIVDAMVQATAAGLPPDLATAAKLTGSTHKLETGKDLIKLFCLPDSVGAPETHPEQWAQFVAYAGGDIVAMRDVWRCTRQLSLAEWREYWAMERVNERGIGIDLRMVRHAANLAAEDKARSAAELRRLTAGTVETVDQVKRMVGWLLERLPFEGRDILTKRAEEVDDETGEVKRPAKHALTRKQVLRLLAYLDHMIENDPGRQDHLETLRRLLQIRLYGGGKTPAKFGKMLAQHVDGVLMGQYVFNGAPQTGRASSRGVQIHNLMRDHLQDELQAIDAIACSCSHAELRAIGGDEPVARKLALLIRPALVPRDDKVFVWSDWSQIEARITPWLCDYLPGARKRLQIFRDVDADPTLPDLYTRTAAEISHIAIEAVTKAIRQRGKVAELALTFCGGRGALQAMGAGYGLYLSDEEADLIVRNWRNVNPWVADFSRDLWEAMRAAMATPGTFCPAGRVGFVFLHDYLGGTLLCLLPSGRFLTYRAIRWEMLDEIDDDGEVVGKKYELTFARGYGRLKLWPGMFVENVTQAVAADILRGTIRRLESVPEALWMPVRLHTHDELLTEVERARAEEAERLLRVAMRRGFDWSEGLPLMSEETAAYYYTKHESNQGLGS